MTPEQQRQQDAHLRAIPTLPPDIRQMVWEGLNDQARKRFYELHPVKKLPEKVLTNKQFKILDP